MNEKETTELQPYEKKTPAVNDIRDKFPDRLSDLICRKMIRKAYEARKNAYAPYSGFTVGAALLTSENELYGGCNIENAAYSPSNCAERTALFKAVSEGKRDFLAIAIVGGNADQKGSAKKEDSTAEYCAPCGVCRQVLTEFCDPRSFLVVLARSESDYMVYTLDELLPYSFSKRNLSNERNGD